MGILSKTFGTGGFENDPIPQLVSVLPAAAVLKIQAGQLPVLQSDKLILKRGEICHFIDVSASITDRRHYQSRRRGSSVHMARGWTIHTGSTTSVPVTTSEVTQGIFYITNRRIVFVAKKHGFSQNLTALTAVTPYTNGMDLQFGNKTHRIVLPDGGIAKTVIDLLI